MKNVTMYVMAHKKFDPPADPIYVPMQVGAALHGDLGYLRDDTGEQISEKNPYYSELTGLYWIWKNADQEEITGLCHYRRYFLDDHGELLSQAQIQQLLTAYDMIATGIAMLEEGDSVYHQYSVNHYGRDLDLVREIVCELYPDYLEEYDVVMSGRQMYFANMFIAPKQTLDAYAQWLFDILFALEQKVDLSGYDDYNKRIYGFISERLLMVWIRKNHKKVCSLPVGVSGDKAETRLVREEAIRLLGSGDQKAVIRYLGDVEKNRPDVFEDSSDALGILWKVRILAEIMDAEERVGKSNLKDYSTDFAQLQELMHTLVQYFYELPENDSLYELIDMAGLSAESVLLFMGTFVEDRVQTIKICNYLANQYLNQGHLDMAQIYLGIAMSYAE